MNPPPFAGPGSGGPGSNGGQQPQQESYLHQQPTRAAGMYYTAPPPGSYMQQPLSMTPAPQSAGAAPHPSGSYALSYSTPASYGPGGSTAPDPPPPAGSFPTASQPNSGGSAGLYSAPTATATTAAGSVYTSASGGSSQPPSGSQHRPPAPTGSGSGSGTGSAQYGPASAGSSALTYAFGGRPKPVPPPSQQISSAHSGGGGGGPNGSYDGVPPRPQRARLGPQLLASCPMLCIARTDPAGAPDAIPLTISNLQYDALVYVSQAFVKVQMMCEYPNYPGFEDRPIWFFVPKTTSVTITDLAIENQTRGCVYAIAVVPKEDTSRFGGGDAIGDGMQQEALTRDPELFMLPLSPGLPGEGVGVAGKGVCCACCGGGCWRRVAT